MKLFDESAKTTFFKFPCYIGENMDKWTHMQFQVLCGLLDVPRISEWVTKPTLYGKYLEPITGLSNDSITRCVRHMSDPPFSIQTGYRVSKSSGHPYKIHSFNFNGCLLKNKWWDMLPTWLLKQDGASIKIYYLVAKAHHRHLPISLRSISEKAGVARDLYPYFADLAHAEMEAGYNFIGPILKQFKTASPPVITPSTIKAPSGLTFEVDDKLEDMMNEIIEDNRMRNIENKRFKL